MCIVFPTFSYMHITQLFCFCFSKLKLKIKYSVITLLTVIINWALTTDWCFNRKADEMVETCWWWWWWVWLLLAGSTSVSVSYMTFWRLFTLARPRRSPETKRWWWCLAGRCREKWAGLLFVWRLLVGVRCWCASKTDVEGSLATNVWDRWSKLTPV